MALAQMLAVGVLGASVRAGPARSDQPTSQGGAGTEPHAPTKHRRVIFNCDGNSVFTAAAGDLDRWIANVFTGLEPSQVDALFWCDGAGGNTANYDSKVLELTGLRIGQVAPALLEWIAQGNDPPKVIVREAKKRGLDVFYSFRINDIHDDFLPEEFPTFKEQHPGWMIGPNHPYGFKTALNFALPEVRALKFAVIEEIFRNHDFDGLEIDLMRGPPFFIPGEEPANAPILTQFLRDVRNHLNRRAGERARPIELAVRVDESLKACALDGFDVPTWVAERLVDLIVLGSGVIDINIEGFKALVAGTGILVYPCLYGWPSKYMPIPPELARGLAANYWFQGADGIYTFNWFPHEPDKAYQVALLNEIGSPETLHGKNMMFAADRGTPQREYPHNWMDAALPAQVAAGRELNVPILVGEDLLKYPPAALELALECEELPTSVGLDLRLNGQTLPAGTREGSRLRLTLEPAQVLLGRNQVAIAAKEGEVTVTALEIHAAYSR